MTPTARAAATALLLAAIPGCVLGVEGVHQNLAFAVESPDPILIPPAASLPIATGSTITYAIYDLEPRAQGSQSERARTPARLRAAWLDDSDVVTLGPVVGNLVTVVASRPGKTKLRVRTELGLDILELEVHDIARLDLLDARSLISAIHDKQQPIGLSLDAAPVALHDDTVRFIAVASDQGGHRLLGLGDHAPIDAAPLDSVVVEPGNGDLEHATVTFRSTGRVTLTPRGGAELALDVVEPSEITSLRLVASSPSLEVGQPEVLFAVGTLRGRDAAESWIASSKLGFASLSPGVCKVDAIGPSASGGLDFTSGFATVRASASGTCELGVELATGVFGALKLGVAARR